MIDLSSSWTE